MVDNTQRFEFGNPPTKFWEARLSGASTFISYGTVGAKPQLSNVDHKDEATAKRFIDKEIKEKTREGYVLVSKRAPEAPFASHPPKRHKQTTPITPKSVDLVEDNRTSASVGTMGTDDPNTKNGSHLPVFPHEQGDQGQYDLREDPGQQYYDPQSYPSTSHQQPPQQLQQQADYSPHHARQQHTPNCYYQKRMPLATPSDRDTLSDRQCYIRSELVEIFTATDKDVAARHSRGAQKLTMGQVGIRCVHCSHLRHRDRAERAVCFPSSISRMYDTIADMQRFHFEQCREIPDPVLQIYKKLKRTRPRRGLASPQTYWISSAKQLGLVDTESGIHFDGDCPLKEEQVCTKSSQCDNNPVQQNVQQFAAV